MALLDRVSEGQLNERLMNAAGLDEPITRTRSVFFFEQESQPYLIFTMIRTPTFLWRSTRRFIINMIMGMESRSTTGVFVVQDNQTISKSKVSMTLFGSTGEPDGRGDGIWDGGLVVSL